MNGIEIYAECERKNLTWSRRDFSQWLLGMNPSYLVQRGDRPLSQAALTNLFQHLWGKRRYLLAAKVGRAILWGERS